MKICKSHPTGKWQTEAKIGILVYMLPSVAIKKSRAQLHQLLSSCCDKTHGEGSLQKEAGCLVYDSRGVRVHCSWEALRQAAGKVP